MSGSDVVIIFLRCPDQIVSAQLSSDDRCRFEKQDTVEDQHEVEVRRPPDVERDENYCKACTNS